MLNGGISLSAIFMAGQLRPQARLTPTSMRRALGLATSCVEAGGTLRVPAGRERLIWTVTVLWRSVPETCRSRKFDPAGFAVGDPLAMPVRGGLHHQYFRA
jgi:hypothetical protein